MRKKSGIFSFRVNDILTSILSALHPFLTLPNDDLKRRKMYLFFGFKRCHKGHKKVPFLQLEAMFSKARKTLAAGSDVLKSGKKVPLLEVIKKCKIVFSSHGKPFRILLIDRCQPFGAIL